MNSRMPTIEAYENELRHAEEALDLKRGTIAERDYLRTQLAEEKDGSARARRVGSDRQEQLRAERDEAQELLKYRDEELASARELLHKACVAQREAVAEREESVRYLKAQNDQLSQDLRSAKGQCRGLSNEILKLKNRRPGRTAHTCSDCAWWDYENRTDEQVRCLQPDQCDEITSEGYCCERWKAFGEEASARLVQRMKEETAEAVAERDELRTRLADATRESNPLRIQLAEAGIKLGERAGTIGELRRRLAEAVNERDALRAVNPRLRGELEQTRELLHKACVAQREAVAERDGLLNDTVERLRKELEQARKQLHEEGLEVERLNDVVENQRGKDGLNFELAALRDNNDRLRAELADMKNARNRVKADRDVWWKECCALAGRLKTLGAYIGPMTFDEHFNPVDSPAPAKQPLHQIIFKDRTITLYSDGSVVTESK